MDLQLTGKTAFVSGSTQGIGYAIARGLAEEGAHVTINGRDQTRVDNAVTALTKTGMQVTGIAADFDDPAQVQSLLDAAGLPADRARTGRRDRRQSHLVLPRQRRHPGAARVVAAADFVQLAAV